MTKPIQRTTRQVAADFGIPPATLRAHIHSGSVAEPAMKVGAAYLWNAREVNRARRRLKGRLRKRGARG